MTLECHSMRVLFLGNNWVRWQVLQWLLARGETVVRLVVHSPANRKYGDDILQCAAPSVIPVFEAPQLGDPETLETIRAQRPDVAIAVLFDDILKPSFLELFPRGVIDLHPSYLPYNRGQYPNVWSIVEETPAGVTLCYVDRGIDTGDIIEQRKVPVEPVDTDETLYLRLERASVDLFQNAWPRIRSGVVVSTPQHKEAGTVHRTRHVEAIDEIVLDREYVARDLINLLRARTFPPYKGAYFAADNRRIYLRLQLMYEDDTNFG